jgi:hypothetical protein
MTGTAGIQRGLYRWVDQVFARSVGSVGCDRIGVLIERFQQDDGSVLPAPIFMYGVEMTAGQARELAAVLRDAADVYERAQRGERVPSTGETVPSMS